MKLTHCLALMALLVVIVATSINCVQNNTPQPSPGATPTAAPTAGPTYGPSLTWDQQLNIYNTAIQDPHVRERVLSTAWRSTQLVGNELVRNTSYIMGEVGYMSFTEHGPGYERTRVLPAAEIVPGNISEAGVNVIAFVDPDQKRVAYVGFVPRPGVPPAEGVIFRSSQAGVEEYEPKWGSYRDYYNVTIVDTGYTEDMSLTQDQKDKSVQLAMMNDTVRGYINGNNAGSSNISVYSYETGYPYRYILVYPMVTIDVTKGPTMWDQVHVLADPDNNRVVQVEHGERVFFG